MKRVEVADIDYLIQRAEKFGRFSLPYENLYPKNDEERRFRGAGSVVEECYSWIWYQCLLETPPSTIHAVVREVVAKSIRLQAEEADLYWRAEHDLACAHLAVNGAPQEMVGQLAESMVHASEEKSRDLCQQGWSGFMKFSLLGDNKRALEQAEIMFGATKPINLRLPSKTLMMAWLNEDWKGFNRALKESFKRRWAGLDKYVKYAEISKKEPVLTESEGSIKVVLKKLNQRVDGNWQENALAILAVSKGVEVPTDPLWFPAVALEGMSFSKAVSSGKS